MQFTLAALAALLPLASANFDIYFDQELNWNREHSAPGYRIFGDTPSCAKHINPDGATYRWSQKDDVSGGKLGIRCEGACGLKDNPSDITTLEMNFGNGHHWTIYKSSPFPNFQAAPNEGRWMWSATGGVSPGYCFPYPAEEINCEYSNAQAWVVGSRVARKFRCITAVVSDEVNAD